MNRRIQLNCVILGRNSPYSDDGFLDPPSGPPPRPMNKPPVPAVGPNRESPDPFTIPTKPPGPEVGRVTQSGILPIVKLCLHSFACCLHIEKFNICMEIYM
jgi:hypothetical protein